MFMSPTVHRNARLIVMILATCLIALGIIASPLAAGQAHADGTPCALTQCIQLETPNSNNTLDVYGAYTNTGALIDTWNNDGNHAQWFRMNYSNDGTLQIVSILSGYCLERESDDTVAQQVCADTSAQKWYLEPYSGHYLIRSLANNNDSHCLDNYGGPGNWVHVQPCNQDDRQNWNISDSNGQLNNAIYKGIATLYAENRCENDSSYCSWTTTKGSGQFTGAPVCHRYQYGGSYTGLESETSSYSRTVGSNISTGSSTTAEIDFGLSLSGDGASLNLGGKISQTWTQNWESTFSQTSGTMHTWSNSITLNIPSGKWGWVLEVPAMKNFSGYYTFDPYGYASWTNDASMDVPMGSGSSSTGISAWYTGTGSVPPGACQSATGTIGSALSTSTTKYCLDDSSNWTNDGNPIDVYNCNGTSAQKWSVESDSTLRVNGKCLDVKGGGTVNGTPVQLYTCDSTPAQIWIPVSGRLLNPNSGKCLDDPNGAIGGSQVGLYTCTGGANQHWNMPS